MRAGKLPSQRRLLFFSVCVPVRLTIAVALIAVGALWPRTTAVCAIVAGLAIAIYNFILQEDAGCRWWFPGGSAALGVAAVILGALVLAKRASPTLMGGLLLAQVAGGLGAALVLKPWSAA